MPPPRGRCALPLPPVLTFPRSLTHHLAVFRHGALSESWNGEKEPAKGAAPATASSMLSLAAAAARVDPFEETRRKKTLSSFFVVLLVAFCFC